MDLGVDAVGLAASALAIANHARGSHRRLTLDQRGFGAAIAGLHPVVELGVDFDIARWDGILAVAEELKPPRALCDPVLFARSAAAEQGTLLIPLRHTVGKCASGVFFNNVLHADQAIVIVGVKIHAEETGQQDAVAQFQAPQFHVAYQLIDDDLSANAGLWLLRSALRH
ncbi:MAG: hypothetical protein WDO73_20085, partial [Ignavibacteriota bacterium]